MSVCLRLVQNQVNHNNLPLIKPSITKRGKCAQQINKRTKDFNFDSWIELPWVHSQYTHQPLFCNSPTELATRGGFQFLASKSKGKTPKGKGKGKGKWGIGGD